MTESNDTVKVREIFSILTQGVQIVEYKVHRRSRRSYVQDRIFWLDADIFRICVDIARPSISDRVKGKIPHGLYLRDVSEVRRGASCFHFSANSKPPQDEEHCLSLVGSECTVALEFPSKFTRDWFLQRLQLLMEDIAMDEEKRARQFRTNIGYHIAAPQVAAANHLKNLFTRGIQVQSHRRDGLVLPAALLYDAATKTLILETPVRNMLGMVKMEHTTVAVADIAELRPGSHSLGFVKTKATARHAQTMSIISSEWVLDLEFICESTRNLFIDKLFNFIMFLRPTNAKATSNASPMRSASNKPAQPQAHAQLSPIAEGKDEGGAVVRATDIEIKLGD